MNGVNFEAGAEKEEEDKRVEQEDMPTSQQNIITAKTLFCLFFPGS
jgi:hypothetical protein